MQHITGISRNQLQLVSLEDKSGGENPVRFINVFTESIRVSCYSFSKLFDNSIVLPDCNRFLALILRRVQRGFHCSAYSRNENLAVSGQAFNFVVCQESYFLVNWFPQLNFVTFSVQYVNKFSVIKCFDFVNNGHAFFLQFCYKCFQVFNSVIYHKVLIEVF